MNVCKYYSSDDHQTTYQVVTPSFFITSVCWQQMQVYSSYWTNSSVDMDVCVYPCIGRQPKTWGDSEILTNGSPARFTWSCCLHQLLRECLQKTSTNLRLAPAQVTKAHKIIIIAALQWNLAPMCLERLRTYNKIKVFVTKLLLPWTTTLDNGVLDHY